MGYCKTRKYIEVLKKILITDGIEPSEMERLSGNYYSQMLRDFHRQGIADWLNYKEINVVDKNNLIAYLADLKEKRGKELWSIASKICIFISGLASFVYMLTQIITITNK